MSSTARIKLTGNVGGNDFSSFVDLGGGLVDANWWLGTNLGTGYGQRWVYDKNRNTVLLRVDRLVGDPNDPDSDPVTTHATAARLNLDGHFWVVFPFDVGQTGSAVVFNGQGLPAGVYDYQVQQVT